MREEKDEAEAIEKQREVTGGHPDVRSAFGGKAFTSLGAAYLWSLSSERSGSQPHHWDLYLASSKSMQCRAIYPGSSTVHNQEWFDARSK